MLIMFNMEQVFIGAAFAAGGLRLLGLRAASARAAGRAALELH
jgi:hypothetical protein